MLGSIAEIELSDASMLQGWARLRGETWGVVSNTPLLPHQRVRMLAKRSKGLERLALYAKA
ncbi:MAG: hypothetical protein EOP50_13195 [Sphingobacteriales bacterium]|nr:MAG: hypothetical protein EOP50_13195 [Sphingobacteriales bacterium]